MTIPNLSIETRYQGLVAGVDEAGRGPWAGPVVAAAAILDPKNLPMGINDSKKLSPAKRELLYDEIMASAEVGVGIASVEEIDQLNILAATMLAMQRAVSLLPTPPAIALIDGNRAPSLTCDVRTIIKGDAKSLSIGAASIIAKITRDRIMCKLAEKFPYYGWESNSGYGTAAHQKGLKTHGITPHHRVSYKPIAKIIREVEELDI